MDRPAATVSGSLAPGPSRRIRTILFDLDGTLADTAPDLGYALNQVLAARGRAPLPLEELRPHTSHGSIGLIGHAFGLQPGDAGFEPLRQRFLEIYQEHLAVETRLFEGMETVLQFMEREGLRWGIVTNKPGWLTEPLLAVMGLTDRAACVVSGDTTPRRKPDPDPLHHACDLLGCTPAECLYIGDAERDIVAGRRAGMTTLIALFGYIRSDERPEEWGADGAVSSPLEIPGWIRDHV